MQSSGAESRLVSAALLVLLAGFDAIVVEWVLKPSGAVETGLVRVYHIAFFYLLTPSIALLLSASLRDWRVAAYCLVGVYFGVEDLLYYVLLLEPLPARFTWVWGEPTSQELIVRAVLAMATVVLIDYLVTTKRAKA